ncbi:MAG: DUF2061 domain-containing protein [Candidatus Methanospirareceae archaeon]
MDINKNAIRDSWIRSWTKSFTWRVLGIVILVLISYFVTGSLAKASVITFVFHGIRVVLYVLHERAWELIEWGRSEETNMFWFFFWLIIMIIAFVAIGVMGSVRW